jgi:sporulation-control protein spo0M
MGMWDTVKGWFNIGGVSVKIQDVSPKVSMSGNVIAGKAQFSTKSPKDVNKIVYKLLRRRTHGKDQEKKTEDTILAQATRGEAFKLQPGEPRTFDLRLDYTLPSELKHKGGVLGALGKIGAFADSEEDEYYLVAECEVKGTAFHPSHWLPVSIVE